MPDYQKFNFKLVHLETRIMYIMSVSMLKNAISEENSGAEKLQNKLQ